MPHKKSKSALVMEPKDGGDTERKIEAAEHSRGLKRTVFVQTTTLGKGRCPEKILTGDLIAVREVDVRELQQAHERAKVA